MKFKKYKLKIPKLKKPNLKLPKLKKPNLKLPKKKKRKKSVQNKKKKYQIIPRIDGRLTRSKEYTIIIYSLIGILFLTIMILQALKII